MNTRSKKAAKPVFEPLPQAPSEMRERHHVAPKGPFVVPDTIYAADLFAGCGGGTAALVEAVSRMETTHGKKPKLELVAVNHWPEAVQTHAANYPDFVHYCEAVGRVNPLEAVPGGYLDILIAGPECTYFSNAAGGKPKNRQSRASAYDIIWWLECLTVRTVIIENVREFMGWGPLDENNDPIPALKGLFYRQFCDCLRELGYEIEYQIMCAADYGDATTRMRYFMQATKVGCAKWPKATHQDKSPWRRGKKRVIKDDARLPWIPARAIIDFDLPSVSIYEREAAGLPELCLNTWKRIEAGINKLSGLPFVLGQQSCSAPRGMEEPIPTIATAGKIALITPQIKDLTGGQPDLKPCVIVLRKSGEKAEGRPYSPDEPLPTICAGGNHIGLCQPSFEPFLMQMAHASEGDKGHDRRCYTLNAPVPTVTTKNSLGVVQTDLTQLEAFVVPNFSEHGPRDIDEPLNTITCNSRGIGLCQSFIVRYNGGERSQSLDEPLTTLDTSNRFGLAEPILISYHGNDTAFSIDEPLRTIETRDRFALVDFAVAEKLCAAGDKVFQLDVKFRMLQPHELAAAHSFPGGFIFTGDSKEAHIKMIGNSWPVQLGAAICHAALTRPAGLGRPPFIPAPPAKPSPFVRYRHDMALSNAIPVLQPKLDFGDVPGVPNVSGIPALPGRRLA